MTAKNLYPTDTDATKEYLVQGESKKRKAQDNEVVYNGTIVGRDPDTHNQQMIWERASGGGQGGDGSDGGGSPSSD